MNIRKQINKLFAGAFLFSGAVTVTKYFELLINFFIIGTFNISAMATFFAAFTAFICCGIYICTVCRKQTLKEYYDWKGRLIREIKHRRKIKQEDLDF